MVSTMLHMVAVHAELRLHFQLQAAWIDSATEDDYWTTERTQRLHELLQNDEDDDEAFCRGHEPDLNLNIANSCKSPLVEIDYAVVVPLMCLTTGSFGLEGHPRDYPVALHPGIIISGTGNHLTAQTAVQIFQHTRVELTPLGVPCTFDVDLPQLNVLGVVCDFSAGLPQLNIAWDFDKKTERSVCVADDWLAADRELFKTNDSSLTVYSALVLGEKENLEIYPYASYFDSLFSHDFGYIEILILQPEINLNIAPWGHHIMVKYVLTAAKVSRASALVAKSPPRIYSERSQLDSKDCAVVKCTAPIVMNQKDEGNLLIILKYQSDYISPLRVFGAGVRNENKVNVVSTKLLPRSGISFMPQPQEVSLSDSNFAYELVKMNNITLLKIVHSKNSYDNLYLIPQLVVDVDFAGAEFKIRDKEESTKFFRQKSSDFVIDTEIDTESHILKDCTVRCLEDIWDVYPPWNEPTGDFFTKTTCYCPTVKLYAHSKFAYVQVYTMRLLRQVKGNISIDKDETCTQLPLHGEMNFRKIGIRSGSANIWNILARETAYGPRKHRQCNEYYVSNVNMEPLLTSLRQTQLIGFYGRIYEYSLLSCCIESNYKSAAKVSRASALLAKSPPCSSNLNHFESDVFTDRTVKESLMPNFAGAKKLIFEEDKQITELNFESDYKRTVPCRKFLHDTNKLGLENYNAPFGLIKNEQPERSASLFDITTNQDSKIGAFTALTFSDDDHKSILMSSFAGA